MTRAGERKPDYAAMDCVTRRVNKELFYSELQLSSRRPRKQKRDRKKAKASKNLSRGLGEETLSFGKKENYKANSILTLEKRALYPNSEATT